MFLETYCDFESAIPPYIDGLLGENKFRIVRGCEAMEPNTGIIFSYAVNILCGIAVSKWQLVFDCDPTILVFEKKKKKGKCT